MGHHHHHHDHSHTSDGTMGRLGLAFGLNLFFAIVELWGGFYTNSVSILSDALHDFGDCLAIALAIGLERFSKQAADEKNSYGYRRLSAAAALITGFILVAGSVVILTEAVPRIWDPQPPNEKGMLVLALFGLAVNGFAAWRVSQGTSLNERMIVWHLMEDVLGWLAVLIGALVIYFTGWAQIDALLACGLAGWMLYNVARNLREVLSVFLQMVPKGMSLSAIEMKLRQVEGVADLHHMHIWSLDGEHHVFTGHVVVSGDLTGLKIESLKSKLKEILHHEGVSEATLEFEHFGVDCADPHHE